MLPSDLTKIPIEILLSLVAVIGGIARYMKGYTDGTPFRLSMFLASVFASGFAGYMFGVVGISMALPQPMLFVMAGAGGFFADQTMKLVLELVRRKIE